MTPRLNPRPRVSVALTGLAFLTLAGCGVFDADKQHQLIVPQPLTCQELDEQSCTQRSDCEVIVADDGQVGCETIPTVALCEDIQDESLCLARTDCAVQYGPVCDCAPCPPGVPCEPCGCPTEPSFDGCFTVQVDPCEGLDEQSCHADPTCEPLYTATTCAAPAPPPCEDGTDCDGPGMRPEDPFCEQEDPSYAGCTSGGGVCEPVLCEIACEYGFATDDRGCEYCACNPPPPPPPADCDELSELACILATGCEPRYEQACGCPVCPPGAECEPCDCFDELYYAGCDPTHQPPPPPQHCEQLGEDACHDNPECRPVYGQDGCDHGRPAPGGDDDAEDPAPGFCAPEPEGFLYCEPRRPDVCEPVACDLWCEFGYATSDDGCETCACNPPPWEEQCHELSPDQCEADPRCDAIYGGVCECNACPDGSANCDADCGCPDEEFYFECVPTEPPPPSHCAQLDEDMCHADPECWAEYAATPCAPPECDPNTGDCDGSGDRLAPPICEDVFVACHPNHGEVCPAIPAIWCEYGNVIDEAGCATGECLPPPGQCEGLDLDACVDAGCEPIWESNCDDTCTDVDPNCACTQEARYAGCQ